MRRQTLLVLLAGLAGIGPVSAQGLGFLFGEPPPRFRQASRAYRLRPAAPVDVPVPVPRPHFAGDDAPAAAAEARPAEPGPIPAEADVGKPAEIASDNPPLPPERPPHSELAPAPSVAPAADPAARASAVPTKPEPTKLEPPKPEPTPEAKAPQPSTMTATLPPLPPQKPAELVSKPPPTVAPSGATTTFDPREPAADAGCPDRLKARGVAAEPLTLGPQSDARCTVVQPMRLVSATLVDGSTVSFPDKPTVACITADAFSAYVHDLLAPLAKGTWGTGVTSVWTGPGLECRSRDHILGAKLSAHGQGLAVDIAQLKLADGRLVAVGEPKSDSERDFETAARAGGCGYFHTVLGPGSDSYHRTHWHFDLEVRGKEGDSKFCK